MFSFRGTVHQSFPDFTFLTGNWIGKLMKLKGEIDPELAIDLSNKATLAFLQQHLGKKHKLLSLGVFSLTQKFMLCWNCDFQSSLVVVSFLGLEKNFNQWDPLIDGKDENLIPGTNITVPQSAIWTSSAPHALLKYCWNASCTVSWTISPQTGQSQREQSLKKKKEARQTVY